MTTNRRGSVLITGASSGIGAALAEVFAEHHFDVILTARREDRLRELAEALRARFGVNAVAIAADLSEPAAPASLIAEVEARGLRVDALVNNAGYGVFGLYAEVPWADQAQALQTMVVAPSELTRLVLPGMVERRYGYILNVASFVGLIPGGSVGTTLYGPMKSFLISFSETLRLELEGTGVIVTAVCPGFTRTEFFAPELDSAGIRPRDDKAWLTSAEVARESFDALMAKKPLLVVGKQARMLTRLARFAPDGLRRRVLLRYHRRFQSAKARDART